MRTIQPVTIPPTRGNKLSTQQLNNLGNVLKKLDIAKNENKKPAPKPEMKSVTVRSFHPASSISAPKTIIVTENATEPTDSLCSRVCSRLIPWFFASSWLRVRN